MSVTIPKWRSGFRFGIYYNGGEQQRSTISPRKHSGPGLRQPVGRQKLREHDQFWKQMLKERSVRG